MTSPWNGRGAAPYGGPSAVADWEALASRLRPLSAGVMGLPSTAVRGDAGVLVTLAARYPRAFRAAVRTVLLAHQRGGDDNAAGALPTQSSSACQVTDASASSSLQVTAVHHSRCEGIARRSISRRAATLPSGS